MSDTIITALISGGVTLVGVLVTNLSTAKKTEQSIRVAQAVTDTKIEELTREVREHNGFAQRVPTLEREMKDMKGHIDRLEGFHMGRNEV